MLKFEIGKEDHEALDENLRDFYEPHGEGYRLKVEGIDPADEIKEALRKEREERAEAKRKLQEFEKEREEAERKRLEEKQEFEQLYKQESEDKTKLHQELDELKRSIANKERESEAVKLVSELTRDTKRADLLKREALCYIHHTPEGIKINGPDGEAWDASKLSEYLKENYPFLADGSKASGGGASGAGNNGGAVTKRFDQMTGAELSELRKKDPGAYERIRDEYHGAKA